MLNFYGSFFYINLVYVFITTSMDDHDEQKRSEQNLIVRSAKSEVEVTNILRSQRRPILTETKNRAVSLQPHGYLLQTSLTQQQPEVCHSCEVFFTSTILSIFTNIVARSLYISRGSQYTSCLNNL